MLPAEQRLRRSTDFTAVVRRGARASRPLLTVHLLLPPTPAPGAAARAGLVVGRAVGPSVTRHRTARRLRHLLRDRMPGLPAGSLLVVRATPAAAVASSSALGQDLDAALQRAARPRTSSARTSRRAASTPGPAR